MFFLKNVCKSEWKLSPQGGSILTESTSHLAKGYLQKAVRPVWRLLKSDFSLRLKACSTGLCNRIISRHWFLKHMFPICKDKDFLHLHILWGKTIFTLKCAQCCTEQTKNGTILHVQGITGHRVTSATDPCSITGSQLQINANIFDSMQTIETLSV